MKKSCIIFLLSIIISLTAYGFCAAPTAQAAVPAQYLRMHIRADSNDERAQAVKYLVRDEIVDYLTPYVAECEDRGQALACISRQLPQIEAEAERVLAAQGFAYGATATLRTEYFPTRVYEGYTLPAGEYVALIVELGSGKGDNWWCVVYPPLCFTSPTGTNVIYKSKIAEIIRRWREGK